MVTLMIPTINRSDFIIRLLRYYSDINYKYSICIGDSSNYFHLERTREFIESLNGKLDVKHFEAVNASGSMCLKLLVENLTTPYGVILPDDDFIVGRILKKCVDFLETHSDYSAAGGRALLFTLKKALVYGDFLDIVTYKRSTREEQNSIQRLIEHSKKYTVTLFCVHRRETWRQMYKNVDNFSERAFMEELFPCFLSVVYGKIKLFDDLYLVRQHHEKRIFHSDTFDWITNPDWGSAYKIFHDSLVDALIQQDNIQYEQAHDAVKKAFWRYLNNGMISKFKLRYPEMNPLSSKERVKKILRFFPGAISILKRMQQMFLQKEVSLQSLLNKDSVDYIDFFPIYKAVTNVPKYYRE